MLDRRSAACVLAMSGIYRRLLDRIEADPDAILERRVALGPLTKVAVAAGSLLGAGRP
jgi:phytoene synthase